jgi:hypothetical protein
MRAAGSTGKSHRASTIPAVAGKANGADRCPPSRGAAVPAACEGVGLIARASGDGACLVCGRGHLFVGVSMLGMPHGEVVE